MTETLTLHRDAKGRFTKATAILPEPEFLTGDYGDEVTDSTVMWGLVLTIAFFAVAFGIGLAVGFWIWGVR